MSQRLGKKDAIMTVHDSIPDGIYLIATSVSPDTRCPAGQGIKWGEKTCSPCPSGYYQEANNGVSCRRCSYPLSNGVTGAKDSSGCTSMYHNS